MAPVTRIRNICFTINNPTDQDYLDLKGLEPQCSYLTYGKEHWDPEPDQTPHLQGYLELEKQVRFSTFKKKLPRAHFEQRQGTAAQASAYCSKEDKAAYVYGQISAPGTRTDLETLATQISSGLSRRELAEVNPVAILQYARGVDALQSLLSKPRSADTPKDVSVYHGSTGTGKTRTAFEQHPDAYMWGPENGKWFNGYDGHKVVIMDEFRGQLPFGFLLRLLDRYPMQVETKGGMVQFVADTIIITSPKHPELWYSDLDDCDRLSQLLRRINHVVCFNTVNDLGQI